MQRLEAYDAYPYEGRDGHVYHLKLKKVNQGEIVSFVNPNDNDSWWNCDFKQTKKNLLQKRNREALIFFSTK